jgi:hypothetical protein
VSISPLNALWLFLRVILVELKRNDLLERSKEGLLFYASSCYLQNICLKRMQFIDAGIWAAYFFCVLVHEY